MEDRKGKKGKILKKKFNKKKRGTEKLPIFENDTFEVLHQEE